MVVHDDHTNGGNHVYPSYGLSPPNKLAVRACEFTTLVVCVFVFRFQQFGVCHC